MSPNLVFDASTPAGWFQYRVYHAHDLRAFETKIQIGAREGWEPFQIAYGNNGWLVVLRRWIDAS